MTSGTAALLGFIVGFAVGGVVVSWYAGRQTARFATLFKGISADVTASTRAAFLDECRGLGAQQSEGAGAVVKALVDPVREHRGVGVTAGRRPVSRRAVSGRRVYRAGRLGWSARHRTRDAFPSPSLIRRLILLVRVL